jgi:predicted house-cleaning noncanonical NTP pyrophosphatase (MazG superfamily)
MTHTHTDTDLPIENQYPKLVRDKIPEIIQAQGKTAKTHVADEQEYVEFLLSKLAEEATELKEAESAEHQKEEIADVREVLTALQATLGFAEDDIQAIQISKVKERGGFTDRIILESKP